MHGIEKDEESKGCLNLKLKCIEK